MQLRTGGEGEENGAEATGLGGIKSTEKETLAHPDANCM